MKRTINLFGKRVDQSLTIHQFANDWITADSSSRQSIIVKPLEVTLDPDEIAMFRKHEADDRLRASAGMFFDLYELGDDGKFTQRTEAPTRVGSKTRRAPAKKAVPRKAAAKKVTARKAPVKKAATKKTPAKKAAKTSAGTPGKSQERHLSAVPNNPAPGRQATDVFDPAVRAHELRIQGLPWREVAKQTGYTTEDGARHAVEKMLERATLEHGSNELAMALRTQVDRYETMLSAWFEKAKKEPAALAGWLRTMSQLDRLYSFDGQDTKPGMPVLVVAGNPEEYIAGLKQIVAATEIEHEKPGSTEGAT